MAERRRRYTDDVPKALEARVRSLCLALPDAHEEAAWVGTRWRIRTKTFAHVLGLEEPDGAAMVVLAFRSAGDEREALAGAGYPYLLLGWGRDAMGLVLDGRTDWVEAGELVAESYRLLAPKKLGALVAERPVPDADERLSRPGRRVARRRS